MKKTQLFLLIITFLTLQNLNSQSSAFQSEDIVEGMKKK